MSAIRLGQDTAASRMPGVKDSYDAPHTRVMRGERTGDDFGEWGKRQRFETLLLPHLDAAYNLARWFVRNDDDVPKPDAGECFDCRYFCLAMQYPYPSFDVFGLPGCLASY